MNRATPITALLGAALFMSACSTGGGEPPPSPSLASPEASPAETATQEPAADLVVFGGIGLGPGAIIPDYPEPGKCAGHSQYADIKEGVQVSVLDSGGKVVALGELGPGQLMSGDCGWIFSISDVPAGGGFYSVKVLDWQSDIVPEAEVSSTSFIVDPTK